MNLSAYYLNFLLLFPLIIVPVNAQFVGSVCNIVNCGQGTCMAAVTALGFECECKPGWNKPVVGFLTFPTCTVPNCSINYHCGTSPLTSPPPPPPVFNLFDPCSYTWCGDGACSRNGSAAACNCYAGSSNLLNVKSMSCVNECFMGEDCNGLGIGVSSPLNPPGFFPDPATSPPPPPPSDSDSSNDVGSSAVVADCVWIPKLLVVLLIGAAQLLGWL